ncbi:MAG: FmdB family transcriptional regulator [Kineosporiaceae bacterium]|nr:FmdB family transcriptional regulator [Aeromicrobium sp.]
MPTYQYQCTECGEALEVQQTFTEDALTVCPNCNGILRKVFSAVGVVFKGSGFYRNDSRSTTTSSTPAATPASDSKPADSKSAEKKKSEAKTKSGADSAA